MFYYVNSLQSNIKFKVSSSFQTIKTYNFKNLPTIFPYVTDDYISLEPLARAQQLLVIFTHGQFERYGEDEFKILNKAMEEKLVKKLKIQ